MGHVPSSQINFYEEKIKVLCIFKFDFAGRIYNFVTVNTVLCSLKGKCINFSLLLRESISFKNVFRAQPKTK